MKLGVDEEGKKVGKEGFLLTCFLLRSHVSTASSAGIFFELQINGDWRGRQKTPITTEIEGVMLQMQISRKMM